MTRFMDRVVLLFVLFASSVVTGGCSRPEKSSASGRELYASVCARCHGSEGTGGLPVADGGPAPRNFRDHAFQASRTDDELKLTIRNGKGTAMPPFGAAFDDAQLASIVAQIRSFDGEKSR